jgi:hypothetical protein
VTTAGAVQEQTQIEQVVGKHLMVTGERPLEVVADGAYGLRERYEFLLKRGIRPNIPYHNARSKRRSEKEKVGFVYDAEKGGYRCPAGKRLYKVSTSLSGHIVYRVHRTACRKCPNQGQLCKAKRPSIVSTRADRVLAEVEKLRSTAAAREAYARRKCWVETVFGELKTSRGLRQACLRGNWKVQVQALMAFAVHNIKQMIRPRPAPGTEATPSERMYIPLSTSYAVSC